MLRLFEPVQHGRQCCLFPGFFPWVDGCIHIQAVDKVIKGIDVYTVPALLAGAVKKIRGSILFVPGGIDRRPVHSQEAEAFPAGAFVGSGKSAQEHGKVLRPNL